MRRTKAVVVEVEIDTKTIEQAITKAIRARLADMDKLLMRNMLNFHEAHDRDEQTRAWILRVDNALARLKSELAESGVFTPKETE